MPADDIDTGAVGPLHLGAVIVVVGERVAAGQHFGQVELARHRRRGAAHIAGGVEHLDRAQEGLARHACPVRTLTTDEFGLHEDGAPVATGYGILADVLGRWTAADYDDVPDVVGFTRHPRDTNPRCIRRR